VLDQQPKYVKESLKPIPFPKQEDVKLLSWLRVKWWCWTFLN